MSAPLPDNEDARQNQNNGGCVHESSPPIKTVEVVPAPDVELHTCAVHKFAFTDRREIANALRHREEMLHRIIESSPDCTKILDLDGRLLSMNQAGQCSMEIGNFESVQGANWVEFWQNEDRSAAARAMSSALAGSMGRFQGYCPTALGTPKWWDVLVTPILDSIGRPEKLLAVSRDITEQRDIVAALKESEARLAEAQSVARIGSWQYDIASGDILWSAEMFRLLDFDPASGAPSYQGLMERYHPDDVPMHNRIVQEAMLDGNSYEFDIRAVLSDGSIRWFHAIGKPISDERGRPKRLSGTLRDITQAKELAQQLETANEYLEHVNKLLVEQQADLVRGHQQLEVLATTDGLTGLKNHRAFQELLTAEFERSKRHHTPLSLVLIDVDHFKQFNDTFGHPAGDRILAQVASVMQEVARATDLVARYGGEEFVIALPETDSAGAVAIADRLRERIQSEPWQQRGITVSIGVSSLGLLTLAPSVLIDQADKALYESKSCGRNRVTVYTAGDAVPF